MKPELITLHKVLGKKRLHLLAFTTPGPKSILINVHQGEIKALHQAFSLDSGSWLTPPEHQWDAPCAQIISTGEERLLHYQIGTRHQRLDKVFLLNHHWFQEAAFSLTIIP